MKKRPVVLLTSNLYKPFYGGVENSLYHLAKAFVDLGWRPIICCSDLAPEGKALPHRDQDDGIAVYRYPALELKASVVMAPVLFVRNVLTAARLYRRIRRVHHPEFSVSRFHFNTFAARISGLKPLVYLVPGVAAEQNNAANLNLTGLGGLARFYFHHLTQLLGLKAADSLAVFSESMIRQVRRAGAKQPPFLCKPGVDSHRFRPRDRQEKMKLRESLGAPTERVVFLCVGRMVRAKGFDLALEAFLLISDPRAELWFVGDGPEETLLRDMTIRTAARERVRYWGPRPRPEDYYAASDCFLMPSRYEPLGQTILEAMGSGLPTIAFRPGPQIDTATHELLPSDYPWFVAEPVAAGLAAAMKAMLETSDEKRTQLGAQLREHAVRSFTWIKLAQDLISRARTNEAVE